jgi:hypothetical protein
MDVPFKIFPNSGYKNSQFQILMDKSASISELEIEFENKTTKIISQFSNNIITLTELKKAGNYFVKAKLNGGFYQQSFEIHDSIRLGSSELKKCFTYDDIEYDFYLMLDRLLIYDKLNNNIFTENIFPSDIIKIDKDHLLFITKYFKNGDERSTYAIYSLKNFQIVFELDNDYKQILISEEDGILWINNEDDNIIEGYNLRKLNTNDFVITKVNYKNIYYHKLGYAIFIETQNDLVIYYTKTSKEFLFEKNDDIAIDLNGNVILNHKDKIVLKGLSYYYTNEIDILKFEEFRFDKSNFFFLGNNMIPDSMKNIHELANNVLEKYIPNSAYTSNYQRHYLTGDDRFTTIEISHQFFPYKDSAYVLKNTKSKTLSALIYRKNGSEWKSDLEIKYDDLNLVTKFSNNEQLVNSYSSKEIQGVIYSYKGLFIKHFDKTIFLDIKTNVVKELGGMERFLKTPLKEYIFIKTGTEFVSIFDIDKIDTPIGEKCYIYNWNNFNFSKTIWFANANIQEYKTLESLELNTGNPISTSDLSLKNYKFNSIKDVEFHETHFKINNLGTFASKDARKINGILGEIISSSNTFNNVISRRSNIIYKNTFNDLIKKYESVEIKLIHISFDESYLSPSGEYLVLKKASDQYSLYNIELQEEVKYFSGKFLAFSNEGNLIYQEGSSRSAIVIDPLTFENITPENYHYYRFVSPDGKLYSQLSNSIRYYNKIKKEYVLKEKYDELKDLLSDNSKKYVSTENGEIEIKQWFLEKHNEFFKENKMNDISYVNVENIIEPRKYIEIGIVGTDIKVAIDFPRDLVFYNYSSFSYDNRYFAYVGKPSDRGLIVFSKIKFDELNNTLEIIDTLEIRKPKKAAWVCAFSANGYFATYDSIPVTFLIKMGVDFFKEESYTATSNINNIGNLYTRNSDWTEINNKSFLCFSPSGNSIALSNQGYDPLSIGGNGHKASNSLHIASTETGNINISFNDHGAIIKTDISKKIIFVAFSEDESKIMSLSVDGVVIVRNIKKY